MALSHHEWHAFNAPRYQEELSELQNRTITVPVASHASRRLSSGQKKKRSHRVSDKHPLLRRSTSPQRMRPSNRGPNSRSTGLPFDRSTSPNGEEKARFVIACLFSAVLHLHQQEVICRMCYLDSITVDKLLAVAKLMNQIMIQKRKMNKKFRSRDS